MHSWPHAAAWAGSAPPEVVARQGRQWLQSSPWRAPLRCAHHAPAGDDRDPRRHCGCPAPTDRRTICRL